MRGGRTAPRPRRLLPPTIGLLVAAASALLAAPDSGAAVRGDGSSVRRLDTPVAGEIAGYRGRRGTVTIRRLAATLPPSWGGDYRTPAGEKVTIFASRSYPEDPASNQRWANFVGTLVHGSEVQTVTIFLGTPADVAAICGRFAVACYSPRESLIVTPGEDDPEVSAEAALIHEYGHHVAANRVNSPWDALDYGTKRWASWENVCAGAAAGTLFPGDEGSNYELNPGEAFAESYRVLNERRLGLGETQWAVVARGLYPDETALSVLERDVVDPWRSNTTSVIRGSLRRRGVRSYATPTAYDGALRITLTAPARARFSVALFRGTARVARAVTTSTTRARTVSTTICGTRSYRIRVGAAAGAGRFTVTVSKP